MVDIKVWARFIWITYGPGVPFMHTVMIRGVPQKGFGISWPFSIPRRALLHGASYRTTCKYKCSTVWITHHTPRNEKEFIRSYTPLNDIKQISFAISFCNEREIIFVASKWSTHGYIKTGRPACHWTSSVHSWAQIKFAFSVLQEVTAELEA